MKKVVHTGRVKSRRAAEPMVRKFVSDSIHPMASNGSKGVRKPVSKVAVLVASLAFVLFVDILDLKIGSPVHLSALMIIPIAAAAWYAGFWWGIFFSLLGAGFSIVNYLATPRFYPNPWIPFWNGVTLAVFFLVFCLVLDVLKKELLKVSKAAFTDRLSGLLSANAFFEMAEKERVRSLENGHYFTLCVLDLDNFKKVNDTLGHLKGDEVLRKMATILKSKIREGDLAARLGGDEFAVLFPDTGLKSANSLTSKLRRAIADGLNAGHPSVTPSIGAVICFRVPKNLNGVVRAADYLMYEAKKAGRNQVKISILGRRSEDARGVVYKKAVVERRAPAEAPEGT